MGQQNTFVQLQVVSHRPTICSSRRLFDSLVSIFKGTGAYKLGVNYAPGVLPQKTAAVHGYVQNLWLHGPEHYLTEVDCVLC